MPNWCENHLTISGNKKQLDSFLAQAESHVLEYDKKITTPISMEKMLPTPPALLKSEDRENDWYTWRLENWGTKWDFCWELIGENEKEISMSGQSAWSPPIQFFTTVSKNFPDLIFELQYEDPDMDIKGKAIIEKGEVSHVEL